MANSLQHVIEDPLEKPSSYQELKKLPLLIEEEQQTKGKELLSEVQGDVDEVDNTIHSTEEEKEHESLPVTKSTAELYFEKHILTHKHSPGQIKIPLKLDRKGLSEFNDDAFDVHANTGVTNAKRASESPYSEEANNPQER